MLSKCANPICFARFRYLRQGRIFNIDAGDSSAENSHPLHKIEHYWLCESCARVMKVVRESGVVSTRPLYLQLTAGTRLEHTEAQMERQQKTAEKSLRMPVAGRSQSPLPVTEPGGAERSGLSRVWASPTPDPEEMT